MWNSISLLAGASQRMSFDRVMRASATSSISCGTLSARTAAPARMPCSAFHSLARTLLHGPALQSSVRALHHVVVHVVGCIHRATCKARTRAAPWSRMRRS